MRGATLTLTAVLLTLIVFGAATSFFFYFNEMRNQMQASGEEQLVRLDTPPRLVSFICYDGFGYLLLSPSQGQERVQGTVYYSVDEGSSPTLKDGLLNLSFSTPTQVQVPYPFNVSGRYRVTIRGDKWSLSEYCTPIDDPLLSLRLSFDGGSGGTVDDSSVQDNDGTLTNATWSSGVRGRGVKFNGTPAEVRVPDDDSLEFPVGESFSISLWAKPDTVQPPVTALLTKGYAGVTSNAPWYMFRVNNDTGISVSLNDTSGYDHRTDNASVLDGNWHHLAAVADADQGKLLFYVDGELFDGSQTFNYYFAYGENSADLVLGAHDGNHFNGTIDEVRVYDRKLSAGEVWALYDSYS